MTHVLNPTWDFGFRAKLALTAMTSASEAGELTNEAKDPALCIRPCSAVARDTLAYRQNSSGELRRY